MLGALLLALTGCAGLPEGSALAGDPLEAAVRAGFRRVDTAAGPFVLTALERGASGSGPVVVYVEGDGAAWRSRHRPPRDPTPDYPLALALAVRDGAARVLYLARPCQFRPATELAACDGRWWTTARYAETVVAAVDQAIDRLLAGGGGPAPLVLVGHSGGGTLAALLAARRTDVAGLVTLAANLDTRAWTTMHEVSPLVDSLAPTDFAPALRALPQVHFAGGRDRIVPPSVAQSYLEALGRPAGARLQVVAGFDHRCCWEREWPRGLLGVEDLSAIDLGRAALGPAQ